MSPPVRSLPAVLVAALLVAAACSGGSSSDEAEPEGGTGGDAPATSTTAPPPEWAYPGAAWEEVGAEDAGFDPAGLDRLADLAETGRSTCAVVTRHGRLVDERYWDDGAPSHVRQAFSVTKSLSSLLVGIAQDDGLLAVTDPVADHVPEWRGTASEDVTIEHLLSNDSGREWSLGLDYGEMLAAEDRTAFSVGLGQDAPPGEVWAYNNSAIQVLAAVLEAATGEDVGPWAQRRLLDPLGMADSDVQADPSGTTMTFAGLRSTCLDLARFGYLALRDGAWDGEQIVSEDFVRQATRRSSQDLNAAYGWLWWVNRPGPIASPLAATGGAGEPADAEGPVLPDAPEDIFWALGLQNQIVAVIPSEGVVAVRMGLDPPEEHPLDQATFTRAVLDALRDEG